MVQFITEGRLMLQELLQNYIRSDPNSPERAIDYILGDDPLLLSVDNVARWVYETIMANPYGTDFLDGLPCVALPRNKVWCESHPRHLFPDAEALSEGCLLYVVRDRYADPPNSEASLREGVRWVI